MRKKNAFTLIELLIVVAIVAILALFAIYTFQKQLMKARDGKRKADLNKISIIFEDYYNDHQRYPDADALSTCDGNTLKPYLNSIPCDPLTKKPYCYVFDAPFAKSFRVLSSLEVTSDSIIQQLKCDGPNYCGYETECSSFGSKYNYGVSSTGITVVNPGIGSMATPTPSPSPTPTPLPSTIPGIYACSKQTPSICNNYGPDPATSGCPITFSDSAACTAYCPTAPVEARCKI